jgi:5'-3' exonuclease
MRLLIDGNSLLNAALLRGVDHDGGVVVKTDDGKHVQVNSAQYGVDGFFEKMLEALTQFECAPRSVVCVWDGKDSKARRRAHLPQYKLGRDKHPAVSEQLNAARVLINQQLKDMGSTVVWQDGMEADDVIGYLCKCARGERNVVITSDGDLTVLVDENTDVWRLGKLNENPYGRFPHKFITLYKSLVGDTSDKIPGAKGFGDAAWVDLIRIFGVENLDEMEAMIAQGRLQELKENVADMPKLQKILDSVKEVTESWRCASLHLEAVNTMKKPLQIQAGMVKQLDEVSPDYPDGFAEFYGTKTLVTAANYHKVLTRFERVVGESPFVGLDIETSSGEESDEWLAMVAQALERKEDRAGIDVLGHELTGMSLTFGNNSQHTMYMTVDHADSDNITVDMCRTMVEKIPQRLHIVIQNRNFEFSVLYRTWGDKWLDNGWHGFVPNAIDTKIGASYVDENLPKGLKERSKHHLGYEQTTYAEVTTLSGPMGTLQAGGQRTKEFNVVLKPAVYEKVYAEIVDEDTGELIPSFTNGELLEPEESEVWEARQYKMNELTASQAFDYGCDDTICTAALHTYYKLVMDIEQTWNTYLQVEQLPEYLTTLAYVQGIKVNLTKLREMEQKDDVAYEAAWKTLREYLMTKGWQGTTCPEFEGDIEPADVKMCMEILVEGEFSTRKRKLNAIASDIREQFPDNDKAELLAAIVEKNDVTALNRLIRQNFTGEPKINFGSPMQMQHLFYTVLGMRPRIFNKLTEKQRGDETLVEAMKKIRKAKDVNVNPFEVLPVLGPDEVPPEGYKTKLRHVLSPEERKAAIGKASTDDSAVDTALALDGLGEVEKAVLKAYQAIKTIQTRRNLFYRTYKVMPHWRDRRIHPNLNQCEAVTRRYSSSGPNIQQMPKRGESVEFRQVIQPHHKDAVVVSMDFSGQELRLGAELSGDEAMTSCYVGENLRDMHSLTAVAAAPMIWGSTVVYEEFMLMRESADKEVKAKAKLLRDYAKTVNFASQYGAMAAKIAETLMTDEETAQAFLDAREAAFPGIKIWSDAVAEEAKRVGYAQTMLGARRHLAAALTHENKWEAAKAERQVGNFWIQGSAAEMTKLAMARMWQSGVFADGQFDAVFYAPIHDEVVFSVHKDHALEVIKLTHPLMTAQYANMQIPIVSSISLGPDFGRQIECGDFVDEEAITQALEDCFKA